MTLPDEQRKQIVNWAQVNAGTENETFNEERYCGLIDGATQYCQQKDEEIARLRSALQGLIEDVSKGRDWTRHETAILKATEALKPIIS